MYIKRFNEASNSRDSYWSLYNDIKNNIVLCFAYLMDDGIICKPDSINLYTIGLKIYSKDYQNKVKLDDNIKECISLFLEITENSISKYNNYYLENINIRLVLNGKTDLKFDSSELEDIKINDLPNFIEIIINLKPRQLSLGV